MSVRAMSWAWEQTTDTPSEKLVLLALADHAGDDLRCFPSTGRLAEKTGLSQRTVRRCIDQLAAAELVAKVERRRRPDGTLSVWIYELDQRPPVASGHQRPVEPVATHDRTSGHQRPHQWPPMTAPVATHGRAEPSMNHQRTVNERVSPVDVVDNDARPVPVVVDSAAIEVHRRDDVEHLCTVFADSIAERGSKRPTVTDTWRNDMRRLIDLDERQPDKIESVIRWLTRCEDDVAAFWSPNVRSPAKLRAKWDQMAEQVQRDRRPTTKTNTWHDPSAAAGAKALRLAQQLRTNREAAS